MVAQCCLLDASLYNQDTTRGRLDLKLYFALYISVLSYLLSCADGTPPELPPIDYYLVITDTIGVEEGDSNYVLLWPVGAQYSPDGSIAFIDRLKHGAVFFTQEGDYLRTVGRQGEGPGEFDRPYDLDFFPDGSFLIQDFQRLTLFDSSYSYVDRMTWQVFSPTVDRCLNDGDFIGVSGSYEPTETGLILSRVLGRWEGEGEPKVEYFTNVSEFNPDGQTMDFSRSRESSIHSCANEEGRVFYTISSINDYEIFGFEPDGTRFLHIADETYRRVRKNTDEIEEERDDFTGYAEWVTSGEIGPISVAPDPYRRSILDLFTIGNDELWVRLGYYPGIIFRVYDMNGAISHHVRVDYTGNPVDLYSWIVTGSEYGFLAYDRYPLDYPMVFILELAPAEDADLDEI